jgi:hypothetical protein
MVGSACLSFSLSPLVGGGRNIDDSLILMIIIITSVRQILFSSQRIFFLLSLWMRRGVCWDREILFFFAGPGIDHRAVYRSRVVSSCTGTPVSPESPHTHKGTRSQIDELNETRPQNRHTFHSYHNQLSIR